MTDIQVTTKTDTLMIQGTTSDAGKSTLVAALCRILSDQGISVAPFKPQNMALNSAVTVDGGEIGRAQALQAQAARLDPIIDMNPVLLKPTTDVGAQVIIHGHAKHQMKAKEYHAYKQVAMKAVMESYQRLRQRHEVIMVEGAGSPAEINLRDRDIANMGFAEAVDCSVILVADIDRGGVFAHLVGTLELLSESERNRVKGFIINRFRGDIALLQPGLDWLEQKTGKPVLGVLPYLHGLHIDGEDGINAVDVEKQSNASLKVVVPILPRVSNHTDFDPMRLHPQIDFHYVAASDPVPPADLIILPGSKNTISDLLHLKQHGWQSVLDRHLRYGGKLMGICGGFQMLGKNLLDEHAIEGHHKQEPGFGYLDMTTALQPEKQLQRRTGQLLGQAYCEGYEIHAGSSYGKALEQPVVTFTGQHNANNDAQGDGCLSEDGAVLGTYLHGIFDQPEAMAALLNWAGAKQAEPFDYNQVREQHIQRLAQSALESLDIGTIKKLVQQ